MKLTIPGRPVPAVRMTQRSKYKSKQAQRYLDYKQTIGWTAKSSGCNEPQAGKMQVNAKFFIRLQGREMDIDNLAKSLLDGLNGIAWYDDMQVSRLILEKEYVGTKQEEHAEVEIHEIS